MDERSRRATSDDLHDLVRLATTAGASIEGQRGGWMHLQLAERRPPLESSFATDLDDDQTAVVLGAIDEVPVGYGVARLVGLRDGGTVATVTDLFVEPEARGVSIGELMMDELISWATERGCVGIDALALPGDRATKNFFERFGLTARAIVVHRRLNEAEEVIG